MSEPLEIAGANLRLRALGPADVSDRYVAWLNDPLVNAHSRRRGHPSDAEDCRRYLASLAPEEVVLGIHRRGMGHVGNVKYGPIDRTNSRADISILIGERAAWGRGIGREAVYLVARHLFLSEGLNRVDAGSGNPAFVRLVQSIGWTVEGVQQERVRIGDAFVDWVMLAQLRRRFVEMPHYHLKAGAVQA